MSEGCNYCLGARLVGWSGAGPILCPECSRGHDAFTVITQAWREQRIMAKKAQADNDGLRKRIAELEAQVAAVEEWTHRMGVELRPSGPDTYGEGVRDSKAKVARLLARPAPKEADHG